MDLEEFAWKAFRLHGSINAYLLHIALVEAEKSEMENGTDKGLDN